MEGEDAMCKNRGDKIVFRGKYDIETKGAVYQASLFQYPVAYSGECRNVDGWKDKSALS